MNNLAINRRAMRSRAKSHALAPALHNSSAASTAFKRTLVLFACMLVLMAGAATRAQDAPEAGRVVAAAEERAGTAATGAITGRVTGDDGRPLADAVIFLFKLYASVPGPPMTSSTDSEG